ncbi:MAG TPA: hypothetical protein VLA96_10440 [Terriglobales bacterium]|jgi:hypothetical protein|nr:hypothetical protein [Terriglobales bacterium]
MRKTLLLLALAAALAGCSSEPEKPKESAAARAKPAEKKNQYETGRVAFQKTYISARGWAADAKPFRLESDCGHDSPVAEGKCGVWKAVFASSMQRGIKPYMWSGIDAPDAPSPGVNPGQEDDYNPSNPNTQPFDLSFLKQDSDKAFEVAQKHGGEKIMKKDPKTPVSFTLDWWPKENKLKWHVSYGAELRVAVDATTGDFLKVEK